jgi:hypothetical protein
MNCKASGSMPAARRYALFTLVGIAGEDDLDAPDLAPAPVAPPLLARSTARGSRPEPAEKANRSRDLKQASLTAEGPKRFGVGLISEIEQLDGPNATASWPQRALPVKNRLSTADASQSKLRSQRSWPCSAKTCLNANRKTDIAQ